MDREPMPPNDDLNSVSVAQVIKDRLELPDIIHVELEIAFELPLDILVELNHNTDFLAYLSTSTILSMTVKTVE